MQGAECRAVLALASTHVFESPRVALPVGRRVSPLPMFASSMPLALVPRAVGPGRSTEALLPPLFVGPLVRVAVGVHVAALPMLSALEPLPTVRRPIGPCVHAWHSAAHRTRAESFAASC
jgi:hypothetical protein